MRYLPFYFLLFTGLSACNEETVITPSFIFLEVDKTLALDQGDQIIITASVRDEDQNPLEGFDLEFFANDQALEGSVFYPTVAGDYELTARYKTLESRPVNVRVVNLEADVEELILSYDGNFYLTTNPWSASGNFSYIARIEDQFFPLPEENVVLRLDGELTTQQGTFIFEEPGARTFQATLHNFTSNEVQIQVRAEKDYDTVTIPIIFHDYGSGISNQQIMEFLDTLNRSFSSDFLTLERVLAEELNPNAVDCKIQFVLANSAPSGRKLDGLGRNVVSTPEGEYIAPNLITFQNLEADNLWDPTQYLNIWMAPGYDFDFPSIRTDESGGSGGARGLVYAPYLEEGATLPGLSTIGVNPKDPDPSTLSPAILLRSGSLLGAHPDYIVNRVGYYLGLFDIMTFACALEGDFCLDTQAPDLREPIGVFNTVTDCDGDRFIMTNHMSFGRKYTHFTYDQRDRMHFVLEHGLFRPRK